MDATKTEMDPLLQHFAHDHPLLFIQHHSPANKEDEEEEEEADLCVCCGKRVEGPSYRCSQESCEFLLHKRCAELELAPQINHPLHPKHHLTLSKEPSHGVNRCNYCRRSNLGLNYRCASCDFDLDVNCALFQPSITEKFSTILHDHPLVLIEDHKEEVNDDCKACKKSLSGPIYKCLDCLSFYFHKECGELTLQINHPYDRAHPLFLLMNDAETEWVYCCSVCNIQLTLEDVNAPRTITDAASHEHPWTLLKCRSPFTCQFCGDEGDRTPYVCTTCDLIIHRKCTSLPRSIRIARHPHPISHAYAYSHQQNQSEELDCRICHQEVNVSYGIYCCSVLNCNYIAHVNCATDKNVWDQTVALEVADSRSLITDVISEVTVGEEVMAMEIKHAFHDHNLILITVEGQNEMEDHHDNICDACVRPILITTPTPTPTPTPFYYYKCQHHQQCSFVLHKSCAELPGQIGHAVHKHLLTLADSNDEYFKECKACRQVHNGFRYKCDQCYFEIDVQCGLLPDTLRHPSHQQHALFLSHNSNNNQGHVCSGNCSEHSFDGPAYRCTKRCDFAIDFKCVTLPLTTRYKYDKHPLTLAYHDNSDPSQLCCDLCEDERDSKPWFYYCEHCDNSVHQECVIGELPLIKPGRIYTLWFHEHSLTFVDNIWDCPPCVVCRKLCHRQALQCKQSGCNFTLHSGCLSDLEDVLEERNSGSGSGSDYGVIME